jgi:hypothetical protein
VAARSIVDQVEALDASGRSYFEIKAPAKAASYWVTVQTVAWRGYGAGEG